MVSIQFLKNLSRVKIISNSSGIAHNSLNLLLNSSSIELTSESLEE